MNSKYTIQHFWRSFLRYLFNQTNRDYRVTVKYRSPIRRAAHKLIQWNTAVKRSYTVKGTPPPSFLVQIFLKIVSLFICPEGRLGDDNSIPVWMSSIGLTVKFLSILREICFSEIRRNFQLRGKFLKCAHQILRERLSIKSLETKLSTFLSEKINWSTLFLVFLQTCFSCILPNCAT